MQNNKQRPETRQQTNQKPGVPTGNKNAGGHRGSDHGSGKAVNAKASGMHAASGTGRIAADRERILRQQALARQQVARRRREAAQKAKRRKVIFRMVALLLLLVVLVVAMVAGIRALFKKTFPTDEVAGGAKVLAQTQTWIQPTLDELAKNAATREIKNRLLSGDTGGIKVVFLTFDDGPSEHSNEVLDILQSHNVKATFFPNGRTGDTAMAAYKRYVEDGHTLGNHTFSHQYSNYDNLDALSKDIDDLDTLEKQATGQSQSSMIFRFPGGSLTATDECCAMVKSKGYAYVDWNVSSGDATSDPITSDQVYQNICSGVYGHDVSVVLCHSEQKESSRDALDRVITTLQSEGYTFLPLTKDLEGIFPQQR